MTAREIKQVLEKLYNDCPCHTPQGLITRQTLAALLGVLTLNTKSEYLRLSETMGRFCNEGIDRLRSSDN